MSCREWLGFALGWCKRPAEGDSRLCLEHIAARQVWEISMRRGGQ